MFERHDHRRTRAAAAAGLMLIVGGCHTGPSVTAEAMRECLDRAERRQVAPNLADRSGPAENTGSMPPLLTSAVPSAFASAPYLTLSEFEEPPASQAVGPAGEAPTIERGPLPTFGATVKRDLKSMPGDLWRDTARTFWNAPNAVILLAAGGTSIALRPEVDDDIEDHYRHSHTFSEGWREAFGAAGNPGTHFALAGAWYLAGTLRHDAKTYEVGKTLFSALIINGLSTSLLKAAASTDSPNGEHHAWPSGHASSSFCFAAVMHQAYGHWVGVPLYGLATLVAWERLDDGEHHFSDVVFGAALGLVVGHSVATGHRPQIFGGDLVPYVDPLSGHAGLAWVKSSK